MMEMKRVKFEAAISKYAFVAPADLNYLNARLARTIGVSSDFYWNAAQTFEKYMKAILITNGVSAKNSSHDLLDLYEKVSGVLADVSPISVSKPERLPVERWTDNPIESILAKVNAFGDPNIRYGLISYHNDAWDLFAFDALAWELRRRTVGMGWLAGVDWADENIAEFDGQPLSVVINAKPDYQPRIFNKPKANFEKLGSGYDDILASWNFKYARSEEDITKPAPAFISSRFGGMSNSLIGVYLYSVEGAAPKGTEKAVEAVVRLKWISENIRLGKKWEAEFDRVIAHLS